MHLKDKKRICLLKDESLALVHVEIENEERASLVIHKMIKGLQVSVKRAAQTQAKLKFGRYIH